MSGNISCFNLGTTDKNNDNDEINTHKNLALSNVPGEVFDDDTILIEIENKQSEKVENQNPLHIVSEHAKRQLKNN